MTIQTPPGWLQNVGATHTAAQLRQYIAGLVAGNYSSATGLRARGGIHPSMGDEFRVHQAASPNMTVVVEPGTACIPGTEAGSQGNYWAYNDAAVTLSITAAHATLPRIDIVVVNVRDTFYSGSFNDSQLQVITGTPASSPVAPAAPNNAIIICQVAVGAAVTSIVDANITDSRFYLAGVGGVINIRTLSAAPSASEMTEGQLLWTMDTNRLYAYDGTNTNQVYPYINLIKFARKTADETVNNSTTQQDDDHLVLPMEANTSYTFRITCLVNVFANAGFKTSLSFPAGVTEVSWNQIGPLAPGDTSGNAYSTTHWVAGAMGQTSSPATTADRTGGLSQATAFDTWHTIEGHIVNGANAGNLQFRWAQNAAAANNLIVRANSWMELRKVTG